MGPWGCMVYMLVLPKSRSKSDPKLQPEIFVGYVDDSVTCFKTFDLYTFRMGIHSNMLFDETQFPRPTIAMSPSQKMLIQNLKNLPISAVFSAPSQLGLQNLSQSRESPSNEVLKELEPSRKRLPLLALKSSRLLLLAPKPSTNLEVAAKTLRLFTLVPKTSNTAKLTSKTLDGMNLVQSCTLSVFLVSAQPAVWSTDTLDIYLSRWILYSA